MTNLFPNYHFCASVLLDCNIILLSLSILSFIYLCSAKKELTKHLKKRIVDQLSGSELDEDETELFIIKMGKQNDTKEGGESQIGSDQTRTPMKLSEIFKSKRILLTMGVRNIGKTVLARKLMLNWARGKSNKDIDMLFLIDLGELRSTKHESLTELLDCFLEEAKTHRISEYKKYKIAFVLDHLDKFIFPLDFDHQNDLTDITEPASVDKLLTNLIKGNLLKSACLWILTQNSAAGKIPPDFIDQVTECQGMFYLSINTLSV